MGKPKKAVPIRKRAQGSTQGKTEQKKRGNAGGAKQGARKSERGWGCASVVDNQAAGIVGKVLGAAEHKSRGVNLRSLTLAPGVKAKKATHAVVCQTLKYLPVLQNVVKVSGLLDNHSKLRPPVAYVLAYEILIGEGCRPNGPAERAILKAEDILKSSLQEYLAAAGVQTVKELEPEDAFSTQKDRYARVNTLKISVSEALQFLCKEFDVTVDSLLPDVLKLPSNTDLHDHPLVLDGSIILQGYGSCMCAHALSPGTKWHILDACAAPGNKTTHLAARMKGKGKILAVDKDDKRLLKLSKNVEIAKATNVTVKQMDFLSLGIEDEFGKSIEGILLDPSCSGSGTALSRMDHLLPLKGDQNDERISRLADFQAAALEHALSFPCVRRIVYSTCSIHATENEEVVQRVLPFATKQGFYIKDPFPAWHRRGLPLFEDCKKMIRTDVEDAMDGFFLALFERKRS